MDNVRTAYERLELIRHKNRPTIRDYIPLIFTDFYEMHGDRHYGDDGAIIGGIGRLNEIPVTIIAQVKGRDINENKNASRLYPRRRLDKYKKRTLNPHITTLNKR